VQHKLASGEAKQDQCEPISASGEANKIVKQSVSASGEGKRVRATL